MHFEIINSDYETVLPIWRDYLWLGRKTPVEAASALIYMGGYDANIFKENVDFWAARDRTNKKILGVLSGHKTVDQKYRMRGIYVYEEVRKNGIAEQLFLSLKKRASSLGEQKIWTLARKDSFSFYKKMGFVQDSDWIGDQFEFGPNCYASLNLD